MRRTFRHGSRVRARFLDMPFVHRISRHAGLARTFVLCAPVVALLLLPRPGSAWSPAGHMVTGAIAFDDLVAREPALLGPITALLSRHPDRAAFQVAVAGTTGRERTRRLLMECARWPDDARGTAHDHPTWHYAGRPVVRPDAPNPPPPRKVSGQAMEALELNLRVAANRHAPRHERAVALCWVMHVAADMHQPLHAASLFSTQFPEGDAGGNRQFVTDPSLPDRVSLHWFWDDCVQGDEDPEAVVRRAQEVAGRYPRRALVELQRHPAHAWAAWAYAESYPLAVQAYPPDLRSGSTRGAAVALPAGYAQRARSIAERRIAVAGYRLADLLREVVGG